MLSKLLSFFREGHERSLKLKKNILASIVFKGASLLVSFVAFPVYLSFLSDQKFGIWLTINSVIAWFNLFDLGLGNGLRNRFAECKARGDEREAASYVSTTYGLVMGLSVSLLLVFFICYPLIKWTSVFNADEVIEGELALTVLLVFSFFCISFVLQLVKTLVIADQRPSWVEVINFLINLISLIVVIAIAQFYKDSLLAMAAAVSGASVFILISVSLIFFTNGYKRYRPRFSLFDRSKVKDLFGLGWNFFVLQAAALVVFMTDNLIISHISDPADVPAYNVAYKYFSILLMIFTIICNPYWSAFTEAYEKNEIVWIRTNIKKFQLGWLGLVGVTVIMFLISDIVYDLWLGGALKVPLLLSGLFGIWVILSTSNAIFANFLSGIGKIRLSVYHAVFVILINIPLSIFLGKHMGLGSAGVIIATIIGLIPRVIFQPIQYLKIINGSAQGIWNK